MARIIPKQPPSVNLVGLSVGHAVTSAALV
jgi:hypothetical protein